AVAPAFKVAHKACASSSTSTSLPGCYRAPGWASSKLDSSLSAGNDCMENHWHSPGGCYTLKQAADLREVEHALYRNRFRHEQLGRRQFPVWSGSGLAQSRGSLLDSIGGYPAPGRLSRFWPGSQ